MKKMIQELLDSLSTFVTEHHYEETPFLTAYVALDSTDQDNRRDRPAWFIELKNEIKRLEDLHGAEALKRRDTRNKWANVEEMLMSHLQGSDRQGLSTVIFTDGEDFLTLDLPVAIPTQLYFGPPQLKPLLYAVDCHKKCLVALFSEEEQKLVEVFLTVSTDEASIATGSEGGIALRPGGRRSRTQASERRDLGTKRRLVSEIAADLNQFVQSDPEIEHIIFGGNLKLAHAVKHALHPSIYRSLITIEPLAFSSTSQEIAEAIQQIADEKEQERDLALVNELVSRRHVCGTAVLEKQGVQLAIKNGQASKLVLSVPFDSDKFDQILLQALLNNCEMEFVHGEAAEKLNEFGGIAAVLYYSTK